ncbi:MAG: hypothetical protein J7L80_02935 [Thermoplasmata archaeon]|nr:hypothetical protein [Thermoplasmata archaeon]
MVAISFSKKSEFPQMIINGIKDQTIRPFNKRRFEQIKRIRKLQLYWKQRRKECFKIADAELTEIFKIRFKNLIQIWDEDKQKWVQATTEQMEEIVKRDGFEDGWALYNVFYNTYGDKMHEMEFMVIRWRLK